MASSKPETFTQDSYNHGGLVTFILAMGFSILFFIVLLLVHPGVDLKEAAVPSPAPGTEAAPAAAAPPPSAPAAEGTAQ